MSILTIAQNCARRLQLTVPTTFVGSTDNNMILLKAMIETALNDISSEYPWPELQREYTFDLADGTASYELPGDFNRFQMETMWNRTQKWPLIGPLDAVEWQQYKSGLVTTLPRQRFRIKYWATTQFFIDPTPSTSEDGQTCAYEYITATTLRPKTWVASTSWTGISYCSYNGNIYNRGSTGAATTGTNAPVHTNGTISDGSISWTYVSAAYNTILNDSDEVILDNTMITDGAIWRFKQERGLDFEDLRQQANNQKDSNKTNLSSAGVLTINRGRVGPIGIGPWSYPEGNFGI
jgi:hypothetical protein